MIVSPLIAKVRANDDPLADSVSRIARGSIRPKNTGKSQHDCIAAVSEWVVGEWGGGGVVVGPVARCTKYADKKARRASGPTTHHLTTNYSPLTTTPASAA